MSTSPHKAPFLSLKPGSDSGTTAVVALIRGKQLIVANAGDSRCVVSEAGKALDMSYDHKPEDEVELARIKNAGGKVTMDGRVNGGLNLSRAIGKGQETMRKIWVLLSVLNFLVANFNLYSPCAFQLNFVSCTSFLKHLCETAKIDIILMSP
jgi:serine/threonine protein phosphatase PrpC